MIGTTQNSLILISKSLFLSFLIHSIIFTSVIIIFPKKYASVKPKIHFLGSILSKQDVIHSQGKPHESRTNNRNLPFSPNELGLSKGIVNEQLKPIMVREADIEEKQQLKSLFDTPWTKKKEKSQNAHNIYETFEAAPYQPLSID